MIQDPIGRPNPGGEIAATISGLGRVRRIT
jgi:hypothetical protein